MNVKPALPDEIWVDVAGFEKLYKVSTHGRVLSCGRVVADRRTGTRTKKDRLLKLTVDSVGYQRVSLCRGSSYKEVWKVHRLVAAHFCQKPDGCDVVNHLDNNTVNNHYSNLEWTTSLGNNQHMTSQGRGKPPRGESSYSALTDEDIREIRRLCTEGVPQSSVGKQFRISQQQVSKIVLRTRWAHVT